MPLSRFSIVRALLVLLLASSVASAGTDVPLPPSSNGAGDVVSEPLDENTRLGILASLRQIYGPENQGLDGGERNRVDAEVLQVISQRSGDAREAAIATLAQRVNPRAPMTPAQIHSMARDLDTVVIVSDQINQINNIIVNQANGGANPPGTESSSSGYLSLGMLPRSTPSNAATAGTERTTPLPFQPVELSVPLPVAQYAISTNPSDPAANAVLAFHEAAAGNYAAALPHFQTAVDGGRNDPRTLTYGALAAFNDGDMKQAHDWASKALHDDPAGILAKPAEAIMKLAERKLEGVPDAKSPPGRPLQAAPLYGVPPAKVRAPGGPSIPPSEAGLSDRNVQAARGAFKVGDFGSAVNLAGAALKKDSDDVSALHLRAAAYARLGRYQEAYADADRGLDLARGYLPLLLTRALAANRLGNFKQGRNDALEVLRQDATNPAALRLLAFAEAGLGNREAMLAALGGAAARDPAAAALLARARSLPSGADASLLFSDSFLFGDDRLVVAQAAAAERPNASKHLIALGVSVLSAALAAGLILLLGRKRGATPLPVAAEGPSDRVGPFRILGQVGIGGMGVVYKAEDPGLQRFVALKRMRPEIAADRRECERFLQEARIVSALDHPGLVRIHAIHEGPEGTYLVFEFVEGKTLSDLLGERGTLPFAEALGILAQAAEAVAYAHGKGVVHRDLKPSNIMLDQEGRVRVMDFGVARAAKDAMTRLTAQATIAGTPPYMSPEQEEGTTTPACDVYALGVCFYEMLTGRLPFTASGVALHQAKRSGSIPPLGSAAPAGVEGVLAQAMDPDPSRRFTSPREFAAALGAVTV